MTATDFHQELAPYIVEAPYISNHLGEEPDGNPILYMGLALAIKRQFFPLDEQDKELVRETYEVSKYSSGVINRSKFKLGDFEGHDDYVGLAHAAFFTDPFIALDIYAHGLFSGWDYSNIPLQGFAKFRGWHALRPGIIQHYKMAATIACPELYLSWWDQLWWAIRIAAPSQSESGLQLDFLMIDLYQHQAEKHWLMTWAANRWEEKLAHNEKYPAKMGSVFAAFFGPSHIFSRWMQGRIFK